ncbi:MAG: cytochrome c oxidase cbb3-type subunit 3 [Myxococcota bacterium]|jgi:cytochrome c oxidase cbb3-type subunit 3
MRNQHSDQVLGHADECDGIEEYDNRLPAWWLGLFYLGIISGVSYTIHYHFIAHRSQAGAYNAEIAAAAVKWPAPDTDDLLVVTEAAVSAGRDIYASNCVGCHGAAMEGGIGPNLTDAEWIHGGELTQIHETVSSGIPEKGMLAWGPILGPQKVAQVAVFVYSQGSQ